jgi:hypothetical protein
MISFFLPKGIESQIGKFYKAKISPVRLFPAYHMGSSADPLLIATLRVNLSNPASVVIRGCSQEHVEM